MGSSQNVKVLEEVPPATIKTILNRMIFKKVKQGETLAKAGSNQEPECILILDGHVGVYDINGKYETNLGGGRIIGEDMFSLNYGETVSRTKSFQTLTNARVFVLSILARDHLLASGHLKYEKIPKLQGVGSTKVLPATSTPNTNLANLKEVRAHYGAGSKEYREAVDSVKRREGEKT